MTFSKDIFYWKTFPSEKFEDQQSLLLIASTRKLKDIGKYPGNTFSMYLFIKSCERQAKKKQRTALSFRFQSGQRFFSKLSLCSRHPSSTFDSLWYFNKHFMDKWG